MTARKWAGVTREERYFTSILSWILGWGEKMEVLEPPEIREAVIETVEAVRGVYRKKRKK